MTPNVTIGIASFNRGAMLSQAVASALAQAPEHLLEVLIGDDCSTDPATLEILDSLRDPRVRIIKPSSNSGEGAMRNLIIEQMRGEFVMWLDDDDVLTADALSSHMARVTSRPEVDVVYGNLIACDGALVENGRHQYRSIDPALLLHTMLFYDPFPNPGTLVKRSLFARAGGYDASFPRATDYDFWCRAAAKGALFEHNDTFVCYYRSHSTNFARGEESPDFLKCNARVVQNLLRVATLAQLFPMLDWSAEAQALEAAHRTLALVFSKYKEYELAQVHIEKALGALLTRQSITVKALLFRARGDLAGAVDLLTRLAVGGDRQLADVLRQSTLLEP